MAARSGLQYSRVGLSTSNSLAHAQPFVAAEAAGAGRQIGAEAVVKAAPDGYTLLAASSGPISIMPVLQKTPYDPLKDLAPVSLIANGAFALVTAKRSAALPDVPTLAEAVDLPDYDAAAWIGFAAPPGTPREMLGASPARSRRRSPATT